jgi:hypothetical protein
MKPTVNLSVSIGRLADDLQTLAGDIGAWAGALADEQHKLYIATLVVQQTKAEVDAEIRGNPLDFGLAKVTDTAVEAKVILHPRVKAAEMAKIEAALAVNSTRAIVTALDAKRSACKYLTELIIRGFASQSDIEPESFEHDN